MTAEQENRDLSNRPLPFILVWGLPIAILVSLNFLQAYLPFQITVLIMAGIYVWMGLACVINAGRCGRLHCYVSGPIFLMGSAGVLVSGFGIIGATGAFLNEIVWGTALLAISTYGLEWIWGPYGKGRNSNA